MGKIVGAALCTHVPRLMLPEDKRQAYMGQSPSSFFEALPKMYEEKIKNLDFDTFLVFDTHWWTTLDFILNGHRRHMGIYTSDEIPQLISEYSYDYPGDPELAEKVAEFAKAQKKLPMYVANENFLPVHYPTLVTMRYLNPKNDKKVLPMSIAYTSSINDELGYGEAIKMAIEDGDRKVVLIATGGLSHKFWPLKTIRTRNTPDISNISTIDNEEYDRMIIRWLKLGMHREILRVAKDFMTVASPEGRFAHYLRMVGALGGEKCKIQGEQYGEYEAAAGTGQVNMWFDTLGGRKESKK
jgi:3,4-dihydroxyphenylacetate 2,3-dioxygenase